MTGLYDGVFDKTQAIFDGIFNIELTLRYYCHIQICFRKQSGELSKLAFIIAGEHPLLVRCWLGRGLRCMACIDSTHKEDSVVSLDLNKRE